MGVRVGLNGIEADSGQERCSREVDWVSGWREGDLPALIIFSDVEMTLSNS